MDLREIEASDIFDTGPRADEDECPRNDAEKRPPKKSTPTGFEDAGTIADRIEGEKEETREEGGHKGVSLKLLFEIAEQSRRTLGDELPPEDSPQKVGEARAQIRSDHVVHESPSDTEQIPDMKLRNVAGKKTTGLSAQATIYRTGPQ